LADITRTAGRVRSAPAYYDARFSLGREILASHGGGCEHGDRDQGSRPSLDEIVARRTDPGALVSAGSLRLRNRLGALRPLQTTQTSVPPNPRVPSPT
jgi:hypothetical protein